MPWIMGLSLFLLVVGLAGLFTVSARMIRRDVNERFERLRMRLEDEANAAIRPLLDQRNDG